MLLLIIWLPIFCKSRGSGSFFENAELFLADGEDFYKKAYTFPKKALVALGFRNNSYVLQYILRGNPLLQYTLTDGFREDDE